MEYKWNINKLKQLLSSEKQASISSLDEQEKLLHSIDIYQLEIALSYIEDKPFTEDELSKKNIELINQKKESNLKELNEETDIIKSLFFKKKIDIPYTRYSKSKVLNAQKCVELVKSSLFSESSILDSLIKGKQLFLSNKTLLSDEGISLYLPGLNYQLIYIYKSGLYSDALYLAHELGHAKQHILTQKGVASFNNQQGSILREVSSELSELKMIHFLKGKIDEEERLGLMYAFIYFHNEGAKTIIMGKNYNVEYIYSELIAVYLFILYKYNYQEYKKKIKLFYLLASTKTDKEIYYSLGMNSDLIIDSFIKYEKDYKEEVNKIKKI